MSARQAELVRQIFDEAVELPAAQRDQFLVERCGGDSALHAELAALLHADVQGEFLESAFRSASPSEVPPRIGGYAISRRIAEGGMGSVYEAVQDNPRRAVALKLLKGGVFSAGALRRFEYETQVLARLRHPGIAQIYEAGTQSIGGVSVPFFAMELIPGGRAIIEYVRQHQLDLHSRLALFTEVCDAVHHGHQNGVIHRDLKPTNILVDLAGHPRIIDFGIARSVGSGPATTSAGHMIGTLPYMSPEQCGAAAEGGREIDVRSDVYSLGVVLYELLCERLPYDVFRHDILEAARIIREEPPTRPSAIHRYLRGELETIVMKALDKDAVRRYQSAAELAADIQHYLLGEPIEARRDSGWYVLRMTVRRHRWKVIVAAGFVLMVTGAAIALSILYRGQGVLLTEVQRQRDRAVIADQLSQQRLRDAEYESYVANITAADAAIAANDGGTALVRLDSVPVKWRNWEWRYLAQQADQSMATWYGPEQLITGMVRISPGGRYVGASLWMESLPSEIRVWRWQAGNESMRPRTRTTLPHSELSSSVSPPELSAANAFSLGFLENGAQVRYCLDGGVIVRWDLIAQREIARVHLQTSQGGDAATSMSPDGRFLLTRNDRTLSFWDSTSGALVHQWGLPEGLAPTHSVIAESNTRVAIGLDSGFLLCDASGQALVPVLEHGEKGPVSLAFSPNASKLAMAANYGRLSIWNLEPGEIQPAASGHGPIATKVQDLVYGGTATVGVPSFNPSGDTLAAPVADKTIRLWQVHDGTLLATLRGHASQVVCTEFDATGRYLVSGARNGEVKLWDLQAQPSVRQFVGRPACINSVAFAPDDEKLFVDCDGPEGVFLQMLDASSGTLVHQFTLPATGYARKTVLGPDASQATVGDPDGSLIIAGLHDGKTTRLKTPHKSMPRLAIATSRAIMASADAEAIVLWHVPGLDSPHLNSLIRNTARNWQELRRWPGPRKTIDNIAIAPDATRLAIALGDGQVLVRDGQRGDGFDIPHAHEQSIQEMAFSPDGKTIATASADRILKLWDADTGELIWRAAPEIGDMWCVKFNPDGSRLAVGGRDRSVRLLDTSNGRELLALRGPSGTVMSIAFSHDGRSIAAGSWAREIFIWNSTSSPPPS